MTEDGENLRQTAIQPPESNRVAALRERHTDWVKACIRSGIGAGVVGYGAFAVVAGVNMIGAVANIFDVADAAAGWGQAGAAFGHIWKSAFGAGLLVYGVEKVKEGYKMVTEK